MSISSFLIPSLKVSNFLSDSFTDLMEFYWIEITDHSSPEGLAVATKIIEQVLAHAVRLQKIQG